MTVISSLFEQFRPSRIRRFTIDYLQESIDIADVIQDRKGEEDFGRRIITDADNVLDRKDDENVPTGAGM